MIRRRSIIAAILGEKVLDPAKTFRMMNLKMTRGFVRSFLPEIGSGDQSMNEALSDAIVQNLEFKISLLPFVTHTALLLLSGTFDLMGFFHGGRRFSDQGLDSQRKMIEKLKKGKIPIFKELIRFYQRLTLYIYHSIKA